MEQADGQQGLNPFGGNFQASTKPFRRKTEHGTFTRASRTTKDIFPANYNRTAPEFHNQHSSFVWQHASVSKKGYTAGFASQTPRLGSSFRYTGPGPGTVVTCTFKVPIAIPIERLVQREAFSFKGHTRCQAGKTSFTAHLEVAQSQDLLQHRQVACNRAHSTAQQDSITSLSYTKHQKFLCAELGTAE